MKKIILTGGGTAGHVYPALAVAEKLTGYEIFYIGGSGIEKDIIGKCNNITYFEIPTVKLERKITLKNLFIPIKLSNAIKICRKILRKVSPNIVFSKGGFVSVPVALACKKEKIPLISHESDLSMGLANKIILRSCKCMCTSFKQTKNKNKKCVYTGQPIREKILHGNKNEIKFNNKKPNLLFLGGSSGAKILNNFVEKNIDKLTKNFNVMHICGKNNKIFTHKDYYGVNYTEKIEDFYAKADVVISRAGSGVINELLACNKLMLLIPLSKRISRGDQIENAKYLEDMQVASVVQEENVAYEKIIEKINYLLKNKTTYENNIKKLENNNSVEKIIKLIKKYELK